MPTTNPAPSTSATSDRQQGDPSGDALAARMLDAKSGPQQLGGRLGYNHLLDIADVLIEAPELAFTEGSQVKAQLDAYHQDVPESVNFFDPIPAPEWLDEAALATASRVWQENMLSIVGVLYAASLPSCYLITNGIPALYETGKLAESRFIFQRIYETGLMLDAVMRSGGLKVFRDIDHGLHNHGTEDPLADAIRAVHPEVTLSRTGNKVLATGTSELDDARIADELRQRCVEHRPQRYVWGPGFVAARKVRLLHASMRTMLLHPERFVPSAVHDDKSLAQGILANLPKAGWPSKTIGVPVNQEDLAYTLLTFGLIIPQGLTRWGIPLSAEDREAFLHTWRMVGYIIGIEERLLPHSWAEAEATYARIAKDQARGSKMGQAMTGTLMNFLRDYLPDGWYISKALPAWLIRNQLGNERARLVLPEADYRAACGIVVSSSGWIALRGLRVYFLIRGLVFTLLPTLKGLSASVMHQAGQALIASWKDAYQRRPFYIPDDATGWKHKQGVNVPYLKRLMVWRRKLFGAIVLGVTCWILACMSLAAAIIAQCLHHDWTSPLWISSGVLVGIALTLFQIRVPRLALNRPMLDEQPFVDCRH